MIWVIGIGGGLLVFVALGFLLVSFNKANSREAQAGFQRLQERFESFQTQLVVMQNEFERSNAAKSTALRTELSQELLNNRKELQHGLLLTTQALEQKVSAIDTRLDTRLKELTTGVQAKLEENVKEGFRHFEKVQEHLKNAELQLLNLNAVGSSINDLNNLLKLPHLRGSFGEATLERLLCDMLPQDGYELQYRVGPNSTERVDAVIKYPKQVLPIDSKFPREQVLPLFEANDPQVLESARKALAEVIKGMGRSIKEKYIQPEHGTTDMALLFVPSETLYFEILRNSTLCDELARYKVYTVSPNTLAVTLHSISIARGYYDMARGVEKTMADVRKARQHFDNFEKKFDDLGTALTRAQAAFNTATTHLSRYSSAVTRLTGSEPESPLTEAAEVIPVVDGVGAGAPTEGSMTLPLS